MAGPRPTEAHLRVSVPVRNYVHLNADKYGLTGQEIDKMRLSSIRTSPMMEVIPLNHLHHRGCADARETHLVNLLAGETILVGVEVAYCVHMSPICWRSS
jgi:hypothetical protein